MEIATVHAQLIVHVRVMSLDIGTYLRPCPMAAKLHCSTNSATSFLDHIYSVSHLQTIIINLGTLTKFGG